MGQRHPALWSPRTSALFGSIQAANGVTLSAKSRTSPQVQPWTPPGGKYPGPPVATTPRPKSPTEQRNQSARAPALYQHHHHRHLTRPREGQGRGHHPPKAQTSACKPVTPSPTTPPKSKAAAPITQIAGNDARTYTAKEYKAYSENIQSSTSLLGLVEVGQRPAPAPYPGHHQLGSKIFATDVGIHAKTSTSSAPTSLPGTSSPSRPATASASKAATSTASAQHTESRAKWSLTVSSKGALSTSTAAPKRRDLRQQSTTHAPAPGGLNITISSLLQSGAIIHHHRQPYPADKDPQHPRGKNSAILAPDRIILHPKRTNQQPHQQHRPDGRRLGRKTILGHTTSEGASTQHQQTRPSRRACSGQQGSLQPQRPRRHPTSQQYTFCFRPGQSHHR